MSDRLEEALRAARPEDSQDPVWQAKVWRRIEAEQARRRSSRWRLAGVLVLALWACSATVYAVGHRLQDADDAAWLRVCSARLEHCAAACP